MYATTTTHLPHPVGTVAAAVFAGDAATGAAIEGWFPELHVPDRLDRLGARSELTLPGSPERIVLETARVVRTTVTAAGRAADGREVSLCISLSPWNGGTAVVVSIDTGDEPRPLLSWAVTRRLEAALVRLAGGLATAVSAAVPARP